MTEQEWLECTDPTPMLKSTPPNVVPSSGKKQPTRMASVSQKRGGFVLHQVHGRNSIIPFKRPKMDTEQINRLVRRIILVVTIT